MATYQSVTFSERGQGGVLVPVHGAAGVVGARPRPRASAGPQLDLSGTTLTILSMPVQCGSAALDSLRYLTGSSNLVYSGGTVSAVLVEMKEAVKVIDSRDTYFATLDFLILTANTTVQEIDATATLILGGTNAGATQYLLDATITHGVENVGAARIGLSAAPASGFGEGADVSIGISVNGVSSDVFFGTAVGRSYSHAPTTVVVDCRDRLEYVDYPYGGTERTYTAQTLGTVTQNLVEAQGISNVHTSIEDSGWTIGVIEPVIFRKGDHFLPWIRTALNLAGYAIFTKGKDSVVYVRPLQYGVTNSGTHTLTEGVNILSAQRDIARDGIYNAVQVDGLTYEGASVSVSVGTANSDVRDPPGTIGLNVQSNLIESLARGTIVAQELLSQRNFKPDSARIVVPGSAAIEPMDVLVVTHVDIGWSGATAAVMQVEHGLSTGGFVTTISARRIR